MTSQLSSSRRDSQRECPHDRACNRSGRHRNDEYAVVVQLEVPPAERENSPTSETQYVAQRAS